MAAAPTKEKVSFLDSIPKNAIIWVLLGALFGGGGLVSGGAFGISPECVTKEALEERMAHHNQVDTLQRRELQLCIDSINAKLTAIDEKVEALLREKKD